MSGARPVLSLCMIVRDSAQTLGACLSSIRPWVDEIIVVDTGSRDSTKELARAFKAEVFEFQWIDDFSAARNESLRHARGEWLFWMDSDDTIDEHNGRGLQTLFRQQHPSSILGFVAQVHCPALDDNGFSQTTVVDHVKVFRNRPEIRFEGRIHEQVLPSIRRLGGDIGWSDLYVEHSGADQTPEGKQKKIERDLRILHLEVTERPDHPFVLFNLGMTYEDIGDYEAGEKWLRRCLEVSHPSESHVRKAYALLVACLTSANRLIDADTVCLEGLKHYPQDRELLFRKGVLSHKMGDPAGAVAAYRSVLNDRQDRYFTSIDVGIVSYKTLFNLALAYADTGKLQQAEAHWREACRAAPHFSPARRALAQALLDQNKLVAAELFVEALSQRPECLSEAEWLRAEICLRKGDTPNARKLLARIVQGDVEHLDALRSLCRLLFEHGSNTEAETAIRLLTERAPDDAAAHHNLGLVLLRQGRREDAITAFENSLQLRPDWKPTKAELQRLRNSTAQNAPVNASTIGYEVAGLPSCIARRALKDHVSEYLCLHPKLFALNQRVHAGICRVCPHWRDPPTHFRPIPTETQSRPNSSRKCVHLGEQLRLDECSSCSGNVRVKVFRCLHEDHQETTLMSCKTCPDYRATTSTRRHSS